MYSSHEYTKHHENYIIVEMEDLLSCEQPSQAGYRWISVELW
jgi:hypothetical protein